MARITNTPFTDPWYDTIDAAFQYKEPAQHERRKQFGTLNIPKKTYEELKLWKQAFETALPDQMWTYEAILERMMQSLSVSLYSDARLVRVLDEYNRIVGSHIDYIDEKGIGRVKKSAIKKKKKNLGYFILRQGDKSVRLKVYQGITEFKRGKTIRKDDYCHLPSIIDEDPAYPFLKKGKNVSVNKLKLLKGKFSTAEYVPGASPIIVGTIDIYKDGKLITYKVRRNQTSGEDYIVMKDGQKRRKYTIEKIMNMYRFRFSSVSYYKGKEPDSIDKPTASVDMANPDIIGTVDIYMDGERKVYKIQKTHTGTEYIVMGRKKYTMDDLRVLKEKGLKVFINPAE